MKSAFLLLYLLAHLHLSHGVTLTDLPWRPDGRCGPGFKRKDGQPGECNPHGRTPCCSFMTEWCGRSRDHCDCKKCKDYRKEGPTSGLIRTSLIEERNSPTRCKKLIDHQIDLQKEFSLHFDIRITKLPVQNEPKNIIRFAGDGDNIGKTGPAIYFNDGDGKNKFFFYAVINEKRKKFFSKNTYPSINQWVHISVEQYELIDRYYYIISIDGVAETTVTQNFPMVEKNVWIYFSGCDFGSLDAQVRDMVLYNGKGCTFGYCVHGRCVGPGKCQCDDGYEGDRCDEDISYHVKVGFPPWITDNEL